MLATVEQNLLGPLRVFISAVISEQGLNGELWYLLVKVMF